MLGWANSAVVFEGKINNDAFFNQNDGLNLNPNLEWKYFTLKWQIMNFQSQTSVRFFFQNIFFPSAWIIISLWFNHYVIAYLFLCWLLLTFVSAFYRPYHWLSADICYHYYTFNWLLLTFSWLALHFMPGHLHCNEKQLKAGGNEINMYIVTS